MHYMRLITLTFIKPRPIICEIYEKLNETVNANKSTEALDDLLIGNRHECDAIVNRLSPLKRITFLNSVIEWLKDTLDNSSLLSDLGQMWSCLATKHWYALHEVGMYPRVDFMLSILDVYDASTVNSKVKDTIEILVGALEDSIGETRSLTKKRRKTCKPKNCSRKSQIFKYIRFMLSSAQNINM